MPVYDYKCSEHGVFHQLETMQNHARPALCPQCKNLSPRISMMAPAVTEMSPVKRLALEKNELAQHEPHLSTIDSRLENEEKLKHGCGCQHKKTGIKLMYTADGKKMFPSMRPWMISH